MLLPIVERELTVAARRSATYRGRLFAVCGGVIVTAWQSFSFASHGIAPASQGRSLFCTLAWLGFVYCLLAGARLTADCVSREKREGNLGLLFLTDLKPWDIVFGKLAANSLNSAYGLIAILPILALTLLLGGVTLLQFVQTGLVLLNTLFLSLAVGLLVSTLSRNDRKAMMGSVLILLLAIGVPAGVIIVRIFVYEAVTNTSDVLLLLPWAVLDPLYGLYFVFPLTIPGVVLPASSFWISLAVVHGTSWLALFAAILALPHVWKDRTPLSLSTRLKSLWERWSLGVGPDREAFRARWITPNPYLWLVIRDRLKPLYAWMFLVAMVLIWSWGHWRHERVMFDFYPLIPTIVLVHGFLKVWVLAEACHRLVEDQRNGALELLLVTPLTVGRMIEAQFLAIRRQFGWPVLILSLLEMGMFFQWYSLSIILASIIMLLADMITLVWVGMHLSLSSKSVNRVMFQSLGLVLLLPWIISGVAAGIWQWVRLNWMFGERLSFESRVYVWFIVGMLTNLILVFYWRRSSEFPRLRILPAYAQRLGECHTMEHGSAAGATVPAKPE